VQAFAIEAAGIAASNGLVLWMDTIGLGDRVATVLTTEANQNSSWGPQLGLCPVVGFGL